MSKSKTIVMVNTLTSVNQSSYSSHCQEWFRMGRDTEDDFWLHTPLRNSIDRARNGAVQLGFEVNADYIYFIDDDMVLHPKTYSSLKDCNADIAMAYSVIRGYPYEPMHFIDPSDKKFESDEQVAKHLILWKEDDFKDYVNADGTVRVDAVGCATVLYKMDLFREIEPPWFVTLPNMTEDVYLNLKLQEKYGRKNLKVVVDLKVPTGHVCHNIIAYPSNRKKLIEYEEETYPQLREVKRDRTAAYAEQVENLTFVQADEEPVNVTES